MPEALLWLDDRILSVQGGTESVGVTMNRDKQADVAVERGL